MIVQSLDITCKEKGYWVIWMVHWRNWWGGPSYLVLGCDRHDKMRPFPIFPCDSHITCLLICSNETYETSCFFFFFWLKFPCIDRINTSIYVKIKQVPDVWRICGSFDSFHHHSASCLLIFFSKLQSGTMMINESLTLCFNFFLTIWFIKFRQVPPMDLWRISDGMSVQVSVTNMSKRMAASTPQ